MFSNLAHRFEALLFGIIVATPAVAAGSTGPVPVVSALAEGGAVFVTTAPHGNPDSCSTNTIVRMIPATPEEQDRMYAGVLTAIAAGKKVEMWVDGCVATNWNVTAARGVSLTIRAN